MAGRWVLCANMSNRGVDRSPGEIEQIEQIEQIECTTELQQGKGERIGLERHRYCEGDGCSVQQQPAAVNQCDDNVGTSTVESRLGQYKDVISTGHDAE